ncbi:tetratricopeptide repeat protein [Mucilaginibacter glaciei]|uniref:histidine kinase n=1 Tax=Mucilaginibacter glaciei TaxID=2772109 RepID=A0A926NKT6_9SPHI|nr:tetratricopeptide repeat protein [Mucilaginibacter glaciei]MBD1391471.1 tetratricopeptide repeat-containing sensor histidine kinase [Mucilaginibacter glaciei]
MIKFYTFLILLFAGYSFSVYAKESDGVAGQDTIEVKKLYSRGFDYRYTDPQQTVDDAAAALAIAEKLPDLPQFKKFLGESYRIKGIGNYYLNQSRAAIDDYLKARNIFRDLNDLRSEAKVNNNIGNLYLDSDYGKALEYLNSSLQIAQKLSDQGLIGSSYLNIGNVYYRKKSYYQALAYYDKGNAIFTAIKDSVNLIQALQNRGVIYFSINQFVKAEQLLTTAVKAAKEKDMNKSVASTNLTLASLYIAQDRFAEAENAIQEGQAFALAVKDDKLASDYNFTTYQLELKRKNYEKALHYLQIVFRQDSTIHISNESTQINIIQEQFKQEAKQRENDLILQRQQNDRIKFWAVTVVAGLLLVVIALLMNNVKRKTATNAQLTTLNAEVLRQKDNLDRINHHLEEIIDERTKDLQIKNRKLSEYSSYLSHQIRGPIATLRGLMNLEREGLVDEKECINMMDKCVSDIDQKIIEMSDMLNDTSKTVF